MILYRKIQIFQCSWKILRLLYHHLLSHSHKNCLTSIKFCNFLHSMLECILWKRERERLPKSLAKMQIFDVLIEAKQPQRRGEAANNPFIVSLWWKMRENHLTVSCRNWITGRVEYNGPYGVIACDQNQVSSLFLFLFLTHSPSLSDVRIRPNKSP